MIYSVYGAQGDANRQRGIFMTLSTICHIQMMTRLSPLTSKLPHRTLGVPFPFSHPLINIRHPSIFIAPGLLEGNNHDG